MAPLTWCCAMATRRKSSSTMMARSRCQAANPPCQEGACPHETGATGLRALCVCLAHYRVHPRRTASRAPGLPDLAWRLSKGGLAMQYLLPVERPRLLDQVQVTYASLR